MSERLPSLDLVATEVDKERERQDRRSEAIDTRAGIVLGFAGALAALAAREEGGAAEVAVGFAGVAAVLAVLAFLPKTYPTIEVTELRRVTSPATRASHCCTSSTARSRCCRGSSECSTGRCGY